MGYHRAVLDAQLHDQGLVVVVVGRADARNHYRFRVATKRILGKHM